jgi:type II secretory pathway pseudopilin PulG
MVIIGILATIGFGSFSSSQQKSRDSERKSDLKQIGLALETYYNDVGTYPLSDASGRVLGCNGETACTWGSPFVDDQGTMYMVELPSDPSSGAQYWYTSDGESYQLFARLENTRDPDVLKNASGNPQEYADLSCGEEACNYGVSSTNTTPGADHTLGDS